MGATEEHKPACPWVVETSRESFREDVFERSASCPIVVDFWAPWCGPCRQLGPILEGLAAEFDGQFVLVKANVDQLPEVAVEFSVQSVPAVYAVRDGQIVDFFTGALPEPQIRSWLSRVVPSEAERLVAEAKSLVDDDSAAAEAKLRQAIASDANLAIAQIELARLLQTQERWAECAESIELLEKRGFLEPEAERIKSALQLFQQGRAVGGVDACRASLASEPENLERQMVLCEALAADQQYEEALDLGLQLVRTDRHGLGERAREVMVDVFRMLPDDSELTSTYRRKLSAALY